MPVTSSTLHEPPIRDASLPPLGRDRSFVGMLATQFLGAFNDNLFKQLVLLLCVDYVRRGGADFDFAAQAAFAFPFVLFSGVAGWLSDRVSKRAIVVWMKVAEIVVMLAGMAALVAGIGDARRQIVLLLPVLGLMAAQSAFFGPAKYGILPEMLRERDLPAANGLIQTTTFLAIIFGMALAGYAKDVYAGRLWMVTAVCVAIAVLGTLTSLFVRGTGVAHAGLPFRRSALLIEGETWQYLRGDRAIVSVLLVSSLFWFVGGVVQPAVNRMGKIVLGLSDSRTSVAGACMGVGIAIGCLMAARSSKLRINFGIMHVGAWGIVGSLAALFAIGAQAARVRLPAVEGAESLGRLLLPTQPFELRTRIVLTMLGVSAGLFVVPLQVFLQTRPPLDQKGRMIGAMNLVNWIGIVLSAVFLTAATSVLGALGTGIDPLHPASVPRNAHWLFALLAAIMLPVAVAYRPPDQELR